MECSISPLMFAKSAVGKIQSIQWYFHMGSLYVLYKKKETELGKILCHMTKLKNKLQPLMYFIRIM